MAYFNENLRQLKEQTIQKKRMETEVKDLRSQKESLRGKVTELEAIKNSEQRDVDRLEGGSLAAFFYNVIGKKEEKLTKEKEEAYKAAVKYEAAREELTMVEETLLRKEEGIRKLQGCEAAYEKALEETLAVIRLENTLETEKILELESKIYQLECQKKELTEAILAGKQALGTVDSILESLNSADGWAAWDTFGGGGLISDMAKHGHLDDAQAKINTLQVELRNFKTELSDVEVHADIQVQIEEFLKFSDYFFDCLFVDWAVKDKIETSMQQVKQTKNEITSVISKLEEKLANAELRRQKKAEELEKSVLERNV